MGDRLEICGAVYIAFYKTFCIATNKHEQTCGTCLVSRKVLAATDGWLPTA